MQKEIGLRNLFFILKAIGELLKNFKKGILCFKNAKWGKNLGTGGLKD